MKMCSDNGTQLTCTLPSLTLLEEGVAENSVTVSASNPDPTPGNNTTTSTINIDVPLVPTLVFHHQDHLGGTAVDTDESGAILQVLDYYPYGSVRIDEQSGAYSNDYKFTGKELDESTDQYYFEARYYNPTVHRFTSQDPIASGNPQELLGDPQQLNTYTYARNNPLVMIDPSGLLSIVIPGTNHNEKTWSSSGAAGSFISSVTETFNETRQTKVINDKSIWSGQDNSRARQTAAEHIAEFINGYDFAPDEALNIVGHSHGGNIGIAVSQLTDRKIDNLVTLGTPVRSDYQPDYDMIGNHINAYSNADPIQVLLGGKGGYSYGPGWSGFINKAINYFAEFGPAGRKFEDAANVAVTRETGLNPRNAHFDLWKNAEVWSRIDLEINDD